MSEADEPKKTSLAQASEDAMVVDTMGGRVHVRRNPDQIERQVWVRLPHSCDRKFLRWTRQHGAPVLTCVLRCTCVSRPSSR
jgi:Ethanolamine utilization protein EutJ (predicted chaperonin)